MTRRFAIDEGSFDMTGLPADAVRAVIIGLLDMLHELEKAGHGVCYDPDMFTRPLWDGLTFWELFQDADTGLTVPDQDRAATYLYHAVQWEHAGPPQPMNVDMYVDGGPLEISGSLAWAHAQAGRKLESVACISAPTKRAIGKYPVSMNGAPPIELWFIDQASALRDFFRDVIACHARSPEDIESLSRDAFPSLDFVKNCFNGIKQMSRPVSAIARDLVRHLAALSDYGAEVFRGPWQDAPGKFGAYHVNISDENGKTKQNATARKERTQKFNGVSYEFWWHTKIEPDRDRIHVFPDFAAAGGRIIVGIFCRHLTN